MTVQALTDLDVAFGWDSNESGFSDLKSVIQELQGVQLTVVSGESTAGEGMTVSGIATTDTILAAWEISSGTAVPVNRTASTQISAASTVTCNEAMAANTNFFVLWFDKSGR